MAGLVDKLKQKVRNRSGSQSTAEDSAAQYTDRQSFERPDSSSVNAVASSDHGAYPRPSLENSAFHVSRGVARKPLPEPNGASPARHQRNVSTADREIEDLVPGRGSSRYAPERTPPRAHNRGPSVEEQQEIVEEIIPARTSSKVAETTPTRAPRAAQTDQTQPVKTNFSRVISIPERPAPKPTTEPDLSKSLPRVPQNAESVPQHQSESAAPSAPSAPESLSNAAWMTPMISTGKERIAKAKPQSDNHAAKYEALARGHLTLPEGFNLQDTEETHVYEQQRPAVTHETIVKERHEIIQEAITRDIHVHHYYTYLQPVKVVEILPPRHFFLDIKTGKKTEIPPPFGWTMPADMFPTTPNTGSVTGWTRHYLVNEEHPNGIPESPPPPEQELKNQVLM